MLSVLSQVPALLREVLRRPEPQENRFVWRDVRFFLRFVRPLWKWGMGGLVLTVLATALSSLLPLSTKALIDFVIMKKGLDRVDRLLTSLGLAPLVPYARQLVESIQWIIVAMVIIGLLVGVVGLLQRYLTLRFQQELTFNVQKALFDHVLRFPMTFFKQRQVGYLMSRVTDDVHALQFLFSQGASQIATNIFYLLFGAVILLALSVRLTIISFCVLPVYILVNLFFAARLRRISRMEREGIAQVSKEIQEVFSGVEVIKSYTSEEREVRKVSGRMRTVIQTRIKAMILSTLTNYSVRAAQFATTLLLMGFGVQEIRRGAMTIGDYVAFTTYVAYLSGSVRSLSLFHITLQPVFAALDRLVELFRMVPEIDKGEQTRPPRVRGEIRFERVTFSYGEDRPVLKDISFTAGPGEVIALIGPSGAGKTTLANLILKFYIPQQGRILLDGTDYRRLHTGWLREQIGVVSQEIFLFNDTVEENIRYGRPSATRDEVVEAARRAHIHEEILRLPEQYQTMVGERGTALSAGQRQRISMARAFLKDPPILILDEPTSALDQETELRIKASLRDLLRGRTTFIISHRMSLADLAHRTLALEEGRLQHVTDSPTSATPEQR